MKNFIIFSTINNLIINNYVFICLFYKLVFSKIKMKKLKIVQKKLFDFSHDQSTNNHFLPDIDKHKKIRINSKKGSVSFNRSKTPVMIQSKKYQNSEKKTNLKKNSSYKILCRPKELNLKSKNILILTNAIKKLCIIKFFSKNDSKNHLSLPNENLSNSQSDISNISINTNSINSSSDDESIEL